MAKNFYIDNDDLRFQIKHQRWDLLFPLIEIDDKDPQRIKSEKEALNLYNDTLSALGEYIAEKIAPKVPLLDEEHPIIKDGEPFDGKTMDEFIKGLGQMGAMAIPFPRRVSGFNMPWIVSNAVSEMCARADVSLMTYYAFYTGIGLAFQLYALDEGKFEAKGFTILKTDYDAIMKDAAGGVTCGAMCLTEPQAGSDLAQIRTKAILQGDGTWQLEGQKIWITCGNGEHHMVLARSESEKTHEGLKGLSLFYVPAHIEKDGVRVRNFTIGGQEKKMGQHSLATFTLNYDASVGYLVGQRGHGFRNMLLVMNDARLMVGYEGIGLCESALRIIKDFANERVTMGKVIKSHEMIADYIEDMELELKATRALAFFAGFAEEMSNRTKTKLKLAKKIDDKEKEDLEEQHRYYKWQARLATPLLKYLSAENAVYFARMSVQILGGSGYMKDYGAEKLVRDSLILPIYEGTSQIQALMVIKDHLNHAMRNPGKFVRKFAMSKVQAISGSEVEKALGRLKSMYYSAMQTIMTRIVADKFGDIKEKPLLSWKSAFMKTWDPKVDFSFGLLNAERFAIIAGRLWQARVLVKQANGIKDKTLQKERLDVALKFMQRAEVKVKYALNEIESSKHWPIREKFIHKKKDKNLHKQDSAAVS